MSAMMVKEAWGVSSMALDWMQLWYLVLIQKESMKPAETKTYLPFYTFTIEVWSPEAEHLDSEEHAEY